MGEEDWVLPQRIMTTQTVPQALEQQVQGR